MSFRRVLSLIGFAPICACAAAAPSVVTLTASAEPAAVPPGGGLVVNVTLAVEAGWHVYGLHADGGPVATSVGLASGEGFEIAGGATEPEPETIDDPGFQVILPVHEGRPTFRLPLRVSESVTPGRHVLSLDVKYQACNDTSCLRPVRQQVDLMVDVDPSAPALDVQTSPETMQGVVTPPLGTEGMSEDELIRERLEGVLDRGLIAFLLTAGLFGFASLLTPCVFPMIPITVSLFTKRGERGQGRPLTAALVYAAAIVGTYTFLGLILAVTWGASGARQLAANPWMNLFLGALFIALALSLFGVFEIRMPGFVLNWAGRGQQRGGHVGVMFMGLAFTLTSFTCTVAFAGFLLGQAAQGSWLWPGLGMLVFSSCFALPFFLLALFPQWLRSLPSSGDWLHVTKVLMGFLELAAALKFLSNSDLVWEWGFLRNTAVLAIWMLIALLMTLHLLGLIPRVSGQRLGLGRAGLALASGALALTLTVGLVGGPLPVWVATYLPEVGEDELTWQDDLDRALAEARQQGRPVFVDFTGYTCTNCRQMEIQVFPHPSVRPLLERFVRVRLYTDDRETGDRWAALQDERFGTSALPFYALLTPDNEVIDVRAGMVKPPEAFAEFLEAALARGVPSPG